MRWGYPTGRQRQYREQQKDDNRFPSLTRFHFHSEIRRLLSDYSVATQPINKRGLLLSTCRQNLYHWCRYEKGWSDLRRLNWQRTCKDHCNKATQENRYESCIAGFPSWVLLCWIFLLWRHFWGTWLGWPIWQRNERRHFHIPRGWVSSRMWIQPQ